MATSSIRFWAPEGGGGGGAGGRGWWDTALMFLFLFQWRANCWLATLALPIAGVQVHPDAHREKHSLPRQSDRRVRCCCGLGVLEVSGRGLSE